MARYQGPVVDIDIHHLPTSAGDVLEYLPEIWREYMSGAGLQRRLSVPVGLSPVGSHVSLAIPALARRDDAFPDDGRFPGTDYALLREQHLDRYGLYRGLLMHDIGDYGWVNPHLSEALCRAVNDWNIDAWLSQDDRLYSVVAVPMANPAAAAAEIRRIGGHPRMAAVLINGNGLGRPLGDPVFDPIWAAAEETGLAVTVHSAGSMRPSTQIEAVGGPLSYAVERSSQTSQQAMHYIASLVVNGVFEKFSTLRFLIIEYGVAWLPTLMWRLDEQYALLKRESPWMHRLPSEYIREHVKLGTQPIEESPKRSQLAEMLGLVEGIEKLLCFSTDYPHYSMDDPMYVERLLPPAWHRAVFCDNACEAFGWEKPADRSEAAA